MKFPRSANYADWHISSGHAFPAAAVWIKPGQSRRASTLAQRRAGSVLDIARAQAFRKAGDKEAARARLEFARDARRILS